MWIAPGSRHSVCQRTDGLRDSVDMTDNEHGIAREPANEPRLAWGGPATESRPVLVTNPPLDQAFVAAAEAVLDDGMRSLAAFQDVLCRRFPDVFVRARDLSGERGAVWYVFRDGHWVNGRTASQPGVDG